MMTANGVSGRPKKPANLTYRLKSEMKKCEITGSLVVRIITAVTSQQLFFSSRESSPNGCLSAISSATGRPVDLQAGNHSGMAEKKFRISKSAMRHSPQYEGVSKLVIGRIYTLETYNRMYFPQNGMEYHCQGGQISMTQNGISPFEKRE